MACCNQNCSCGCANNASANSNSYGCNSCGCNSCSCNSCGCTNNASANNYACNCERQLRNCSHELRKAINVIEAIDTLADRYLHHEIDWDFCGRNSNRNNNCGCAQATTTTSNNNCGCGCSNNYWGR